MSSRTIEQSHREWRSNLERGCRYLRDGTLFGRLVSRWHEYRRAQRRRWWDNQQGHRAYYDVSLGRGVKMRLYLDDHLCRMIYCDDFEAAERLFLRHFLKPGDTFVDIGANIGLFTITAARLAGPSGRVHAFEPARRTFDRLLENLRLNNFTNVSCHRLAVADQAGAATLTTPVDGFGAWSSFARPLEGQSLSSEAVATVSWDHFATEHELVGRVAMMKIDVEGWEARVLAGAARTLSRPDAPVLQVEFTEEAAWAAGSSCERLYQVLEQLGYRMYLYDPRVRRLVHDPLRNRYPYLNLLAAKRPDDVAARVGTYVSRQGPADAACNATMPGCRQTDTDHKRS